MGCGYDHVNDFCALLLSRRCLDLGCAMGAVQGLERVVSGEGRGIGGDLGCGSLMSRKMKREIKVMC
jgi:hypothetical protein